MKIYTKTGDKGKTSLYTGERIEKSDHIFDALGSIDEVNAYLP
jgi:cob(I)alamin adenosyltransferase